jgi:predicted component of type VI protein secretion system
MRWVAVLCFLFFSTSALALDDCNAKFPNTDQLEERLKCLQSNNNSLQSQIDALKAGPSSEHATARPEAKPPVAKPMAKPVAKPMAKPVAKPMAKPVAKPMAKPIANPMTKPQVTTRQPLTRGDCKKAGLQWNSNANVCGR